MLGSGSLVKVRCPKTKCPHHNLNTPWAVYIGGADTGRLRLQRCRSPFCKKPCHVRGWLDNESVTYNNGKPICNWSWSCGYFAPNTRIIAWCKESSCLNFHDGFTLIT